MDGLFQLIWQLDINIVAMVILLLVYLTAFKRLDTTNKINNLFMNISILIIIALFVESLKCIINRQPYSWMIPVAKALNFVLFILGPYITYLWITFVRRWVFTRKEKRYKSNLLFLIPILLNTILSVLSLFNGIVFHVNQYNEFVKGKIFFIPITISLAYLFLSLIFIISKKRKIEKDEFKTLVIFGGLPAFGGLFQLLFPGVKCLWSLAAFALIILYIHIQQRLIQIDKLTGAWTRSTFEQYLDQRTKNIDEGQFGIIFMDLDGFKRINDAFGHIEGDAALKKVVELLKYSIKKTDIVARFGGDEFVILVNTETFKELQEIVKNINQTFTYYNETTKKPYKIEYSVGYEIYKPDSHKVGKFINHVDNLMYISKENKRRMSIFPNKPW